MRIFVLAGLVAMGCSGPEGNPPLDDPFAPFILPDSGCDEDCEDDGFFPAINIFIDAQFGYDAATRTARTVDVAGIFTVAPAFEIYLGIDGWQLDLNNIESYCFIQLPFIDAGPWQGYDSRLYAGVQYDLASSPPITNCNTEGYELDPAVWGNDIVRDFVQSYDANYFMAAGRPTTLIARDVIPQFPPEIQPLVIGGSLGVPNFLGFQVDEIYGFAWRVDHDLQADLDVTGYLVGLESSSVDTGANMVTAWYDLRSYVYWSVQ